MLFYRGAFSPERKPEKLRFEALRFEPSFIAAAERAAGEKSENPFGAGYVQEYKLLPRRLLLRETPEALKLASEYVGPRLETGADLALFSDPTPDWIKFLIFMGFEGTLAGDSGLRLFNLSGVKLCAQWRVRWDPKRRRFLRETV